MKKIIILILTSMLLCGCANKPTEVECDVITIRPYTETHENGLFVKKQSHYDYIEYTYEYNGEIYLDVVRNEIIKIGDRTKALIEERDGVIFSDNLYLSLEEYKKLYNLVD